MFDDKSRYAPLETYVVIDRHGVAVRVVPVPDAPGAPLVGYHLRREGERVDHLAAAYLKDDAGWWRIAEQADVIIPDALAEAREIPIPGPPPEKKG